MTFMLLLALLQQPSHDHHAGVDRRGDAVMGFSHEHTTHHFRLRVDGGDIEITTKAPDDPENADRIRGHLRHIARMFADGNFTAPFLIHGADPPGVGVMTRLKGEIAYRFEPIAGGGRVRLVTANRAARDAVHAFLRFQIEDHRTGDPLTIRKE